MTVNQNLIRWISGNKQIGSVFSFERNGELCWSSVAIQKWGNVIKVYVDEIFEFQIDAENYLREEIVEFDSIESAIEFISSSTMAESEQLLPCKGQKIFNPEFSNK